METDTDRFQLWEQELNNVGGEMDKYEMIDLPKIAIIGKEGKPNFRNVGALYGMKYRHRNASSEAFHFALQEEGLFTLRIFEATTASRRGHRRER